MVQALYKTHNLNIQNLLAIGLHILALWNKRTRLNITGKLEWALSSLLTHNLAGMSSTLSVDKSGVGAALNMQGLYVNLTHLKLWLQREAVALFKQSAVLKYHRISAINHILSRLAESAT